jgi:predicted nucleotidyltransferase
MKLKTAEKLWLKEYCHELNRLFPGQIERLSIYGSKARGDAGAESDLDVLLIVKNELARLKPQIRRVGYMLAADGKVVPSILAYTTREWDQRRKSGSVLRRAVERDEVRVL